MDIKFDEKPVRNLLTDYHNLHGVGIGLYDSDFNPLLLLPEGNNDGFCQLIRREDKVLKACRHCDKNAFDIAAKKKDLYVYRCHLGLFEAVAPIMDDSIIIGYVMIGQFLDSTAVDSQWHKIKAHCIEHFSLDISDYKEPFYHLKTFPQEKIKAMTNIMMACAAYIWYKKMARIERSGLFERINIYMHDHLSEVLTIEMLCSHLKISRTTLYNTISVQTGKGFTEYLRQLRLEESKKLLAASDLRIKDIAEAVGIDDYNYFSRLFKKSYGLTPRAFRTQGNTH